jgi:hypothetical protein
MFQEIYRFSAKSNVIPQNTRSQGGQKIINVDIAGFRPIFPSDNIAFSADQCYSIALFQFIGDKAIQ